MSAFVEKHAIRLAEIGTGRRIGLTLRATRTRRPGSGLGREVGTGPQDPKRRYFRAP